MSFICFEVRVKSFWDNAFVGPM